MRPKSVALKSRKDFQVLEINFFRKKKFFPGNLCRYDLQNSVQKFCLNDQVLRYVSFVDC